MIHEQTESIEAVLSFSEDVRQDVKDTDFLTGVNLQLLFLRKNGRRTIPVAIAEII